MRHMLGLLRDEKGTTTVEFALVGLAFISALLFTMIVAQILYFNQRLDYATDKASRQVLIGNAQQQQTPVTLATFTQSVCNNLPAGMSCSDLIVNLYVVNQGGAGYYTYAKADLSGLALPPLTPGSGQFTLGNQGDYQYLQVIYPVTFLPKFMTACSIRRRPTKTSRPT